MPGLPRVVFVGVSQVVGRGLGPGFFLVVWRAFSMRLSTSLRRYFTAPAENAYPEMMPALVQRRAVSEQMPRRAQSSARDTKRSSVFIVDLVSPPSAPGTCPQLGRFLRIAQTFRDTQMNAKARCPVCRDLRHLSAKFGERRSCRTQSLLHLGRTNRLRSFSRSSYSEGQRLAELPTSFWPPRFGCELRRRSRRELGHLFTPSRWQYREVFLRCLFADEGSVVGE